jgi:hypothetical protein
VRRKLPWKRIAIVAGILIGIYAVVEIVLAGFGAPPLPPAQQGITLKGGHVNGNKISTKSWSFDYESAQLSPDGTTGTVAGVRNGIVLRHGKPYLKVSAAQITIDTQSLNFTAVGKVHVEFINDPAKRSFDTDLVQWTNSDKQLHMDHTSYLHTADQTLKIESVDIDFDKDTVHLGKLTGGLRVPKT